MFRIVTTAMIFIVTLLSSVNAQQPLAPRTAEKPSFTSAIDQLSAYRQRRDAMQAHSMARLADAELDRQRAEAERAQALAALRTEAYRDATGIITERTAELRGNPNEATFASYSPSAHGPATLSSRVAQPSQSGATLASSGGGQGVRGLRPVGGGELQPRSAQPVYQAPGGREIVDPNNPLVRYTPEQREAWDDMRFQEESVRRQAHLETEVAQLQTEVARSRIENQRLVAQVEEQYANIRQRDAYTNETYHETGRRDALTGVAVRGGHAAIDQGWVNSGISWTHSAIDIANRIRDFRRH